MTGIQISDMRKNMWIIAFIFFVVGDLITTYFGMTSPNIIEQNPIAESWFNNDNFVALFLFKIIPFIAFYWVDILLYKYLEEFAFPVIPLYLAWIGLQVTIDNVNVLQSVGMNTTLVIVVFIILAYLSIETVKAQFGYDVTT